jgi:hypothetical protein
MGRKSITLCSALIILLFSFLNCKSNSAQNNLIEEHATKMLRNFYTSYINLIARERLFTDVEIDSIRSIYCTTKLINEIKNKYLTLELDFDPFLHAQHSETDWLKTLSIRKDLKRNDIYYISYAYANRLRTTKLHIVAEKGDYKIDHIFLEDFKEENIDNQ